MKRLHAPPALLATALVAVVALASACSSASSKEATSTTTSSTTTVPAPSVHSTVEDGATNVAVSKAIGVTVEQGTLAKVAIVATGDAAPKPGDGLLNAAHTGWMSPSNFAPHTTYRLTATIEDGAGKANDQTWTFTTGAPTKELHTSLNVGDGATYGVGMPIIVTLNNPVPEALHQALTDRLEVTSTPSVTGSWRWFSDTEVHYRPSEYWPAHTKVSLKVDFTGLDAGGGTWGVDGRTVNFAIGDSHISNVDAAAHKMVVRSNGTVVREMPVSTGNDKYPTKSGTHVVNEKSPSVVMDSATVGIPRNSPDGYYETVLWDVRISNSGEFVHAAPWSTGAQGNSNVSHGCVNASDADAQWFYNFTQTGDVVTVMNTPVQLEPWNGYGDWQVPYDQWAN